MNQLKEIGPSEGVPTLFSPPLIKEANRRYLISATQGWLAPLALTLTMKQRLPKLGVRLTREKATQNLHHFLNVVNYEIFGKAFSRHGNQLKAVAVLEWPLGGRCHYHAMMDCPVDLDSVILIKVIREGWQRTQWGYHELKVKPIYDRIGWIDYMIKQSNLADDAIDWENCILS